MYKHQPWRQSTEIFTYLSTVHAAASLHHCPFY